VTRRNVDVFSGYYFSGTNIIATTDQQVCGFCVEKQGKKSTFAKNWKEKTRGRQRRKV
jgi:hypothetical protein